MTLPVHPLKGAELRVVRWRRARDGRRHVEVEHPRGWIVSLPVSWTDAGIPTGLAEKDGALVKLAPEALLDLVCAVRDLGIKGRKARS